MTEKKTAKKAPKKAAKKAEKKEATPPAKAAGGEQGSKVESGAQEAVSSAPSATGLGTRGRTFMGRVVSDRMARTVTVEWERRHFVPKYQRYERRYSKVKAHNPDEIDAKMGDTVTIMETRPISKTKHFIIIKKH